jgi:DNA-binding NtrC family response regulator
MDSPELIAGITAPGTPAVSDDLAILATEDVDVCILLTGRTSARTIARRIHGLRGRQQGPFMAVDCGWPEGVLERRMFDVLPSTPGTIFLEEVWKLSLAQQGRLLDALTDCAPPWGSRRACARVMASSSKPLLPRVEEGTFNDRLFYRLNAVHLVLPSRE